MAALRGRPGDIDDYIDDERHDFSITPFHAIEPGTEELRFILPN